MSVVLLFGAIVAVVFGLALCGGRRFGPLALSVAAGSILAGLWSGHLALIVGGLGIQVPGLPSQALATVILTIVPLGVLLMGGPRYNRLWQRIISAALIALLTAALLVHPLGHYLKGEGETLAIYTLLADWWRYIVTIGLVAGLADVFVLHTVPTKAARSSKKH